MTSCEFLRSKLGPITETLALDEDAVCDLLDSYTAALRAELQQANARLKGMTADRDYWKERYHAK